jgi:hypothetical protein
MTVMATTKVLRGSGKYVDRDELWGRVGVVLAQLVGHEKRPLGFDAKSGPQRRR